MSALFPSKSAHHSEDFFKTDDFKATRQKEPRHSYIRALFDKKNLDMAKSELFSIKNPGICSGTLQRRIRTILRKESQAPCAKQQEARGLHPNGSTFFIKKVHTTRRSHEALHGFAQESTRTTLVPTRRDLKEQDEASRTQP